METMPMARLMSDMLLLPDGTVIIINGAGSGTAGWEAARNPVIRPLIYKPHCHSSNRFSVMAPATRPRLYHSTAVLLADGRVLVGGSNPHVYYNFTRVIFPTDLSLESFSPPYLSSLYDPLRPSLVEAGEIVIRYNDAAMVMFRVPQFMKLGVVTVRIVAPAFNTHSFSMNQRMVVLRGGGVEEVGGNVYRVRVMGPSSMEIAPPGYYLLFVVHAGIPSLGMWVSIQ